MDNNFKFEVQLYIDDDFIVYDEIDDLLDVDSDTLIKLDNFYDIYDEQKYIEKLLPLFQKLQESGKKYNVQICILNFELLKKSGLLNFSNINLLIQNSEGLGLANSTPYTKEEFWKVDEKLEELVKPVREANLSSYERFLAVYEIAKNYKSGKEYERDKEDTEVSRRLGNILFNDYIVCRGFANLLSALCNKVDIPIYDFGLTTRGVAENRTGKHARNIVKLDDDKYNIHGIYVTDATWDNAGGLELFNNLALTFDRKKEADWMESLEDVDLLFDFHDMNDFTNKINFFLKRAMRENKSDGIKGSYSKIDDSNDSIKNAYFQIYTRILELLSRLDYNKYMYFFNKYNNMITKNNNGFDLNEYPIWLMPGDRVSFVELESAYVDFLTEYAQYVIPLSNKAISNDTMLAALTVVKSQIKKYNLEQLQSYRDKVIKDNEEEASYAFPYVYDPNNPRLNYLESREEVEGRSR